MLLPLGLVHLSSDQSYLCCAVQVRFRAKLLTLLVAIPTARGVKGQRTSLLHLCHPVAGEWQCQLSHTCPQDWLIRSSGSAPLCCLLEVLDSLS